MTESDSMWRLPKNTSAFKTDNCILVEHYEYGDEIDLSCPQVQDELFRSFRKVKSFRDSLSWCKRYGCPWENTDNFSIYNPFMTATLAKSVDFVWYFGQLLKHQEVDFIRKHLRFQNDLNAITTKMTEEEYHALFDRLNDESKDTEMDDLLKYYQLMRASEHLERGCVIFTRNSGFETEIAKVESTFGLSGLPIKVSELELEIKIENIERLNDDYDLLDCAHTFLQKAVTQLLSSCQPSIRVEKPQNRNEYDFILHQTFNVSTPWQAIISELVKRITGQAAVRKCANVSCNATFIPRRADNIFCSKPACRKAVSRRRKN